jgi:hypothetical protein
VCSRVRLLHDCAVSRHELIWSEFESQFVDLAVAVKAERHLEVFLVDQSGGGDSNVEAFVERPHERNSVRHLPRGDILTIHIQHAGAALAGSGYHCAAPVAAPLRRRGNDSEETS